MLLGIRSRRSTRQDTNQHLCSAPSPQACPFEGKAFSGSGRFRRAPHLPDQRRRIPAQRSHIHEEEEIVRLSARSPSGHTSCGGGNSTRQGQLSSKGGNY